MGMTGQDIYDNFHQHAQGTGSWQASQHAAWQMAEDLPSQATQIKRLQDGMTAAWTGDAADAAQQAVTPLALEHLNVADDLHATQDLMSRQAASFHQAANAVRPMPPEPTLHDPLAAIVAGQNPETMLAQVTVYNAPAQHNVDVMTAYHGASSYNTANMPAAYGRLADSPSAVTVEPVPGGDRSTSATASAHPRGAGRPANPSGTAPTPTTGESKPSVGVLSPGGVGSTAPSGTERTVGTGDQGQPGAADEVPTTGPALVTDNGGPAGRLAEPLIGRLGSHDPAVAGAGGQRLLGAGQVGGPGDGGPDGSPLDRGGRSGVADGSAAAEAEDEVLAARTGEPDAGVPAAVPPGAGQRGEPDDEYDRKYPMTMDGDALFAGGLPKVAPEAFGESPQERAARHAREADGGH